MPHVADEKDSDEAIAARVQSGDRESFGILVDRYEKKMTRYADRFLYDYEDRRDAVQDVFVRAYERIQSFRTSERFSPWLYRLAHNVFVNIIRKRGRERISFVDLDTLFPGGIPDDLHHAPELPDMERHVKQLDPKYREVVVLFYYEEKSYEDIANILHIPTSTVGVRLARARKILSSLIQDYDN